MKPLDAALLLLLAGRHYGYYHLPAAMQSGAFSVCAALALIVCLFASELPRPLAAWAIGEEAQVAGCTAAWMVKPWDNSSGELCSDLLGFKLGAIGLAWLALAVFKTAQVSSYAKAPRN